MVPSPSCKARLEAGVTLARGCSAFDRDDLFSLPIGYGGNRPGSRNRKVPCWPKRRKTELDSDGARIRARGIRGLAIPPTGAWEFAGKPAPDPDQCEERTRHQYADGARDRGDVLPRHLARSGGNAHARIVACV